MSGRDEKWQTAKWVNATGGPVWQVAYSPDSRHLAACSCDNTIYIWEAKTGLTTTKLTGHGDRVVTLAYSPDGKHLVSAAHDQTIRIWDTYTGTEVGRLSGGHSTLAMCINYSPDGRFIAHRSDPGFIDIWNAETRTLIKSFGGPPGFGFLVYSPDGKRLASCGSNGIHVWDTATWSFLGSLDGHSAQVRCVTYSSDGKYMASCGDDMTVRLWDSTKLTQTALLKGHRNAIYIVAFSPDDDILLSSSLDATVFKWHVKAGEQLRVGEPIITFVPVVCAVFSPDGSQVAFSFDDGTVRAWDATSDDFGIDPASQNLYIVMSVACSPDEKEFASAGISPTINIHEIETGSVLRSFAGHTEAVTSLAYSPDGKLLASGSLDWSIRVWDPALGTQLHMLERANSIKAVAFSLDGKYVRSADHYGNIGCWQYDSGTELGTSAAQDTDTTCEAVCFSSDRKQYAIGREKTIQLGSLEGSDEAHIEKRCSLEAAITALTFSHDGAYLASASKDQKIRIWDVESCTEVIHFASRTNQEILCIDFSPSGKRLVTAGEGERIRQWDSETGKLLCTLQGHNLGIESIVYTSDGKHIISGSIDGTCRIWSSDTSLTSFIPEIGLELSSLSLNDGWVKSPTGELLLWVPPDYRNGVQDMCESCVPAGAPGHPIRLDWSKLPREEAWRDILRK